MLSRSYMAGFFDGEGSVGIYTNGSGLFHLRSQVVQTGGVNSEKILRAFCDEFGGNMSPQKSTSGKIKFNWQLSSFPAMRFVSSIRPHLILKLEQVDIGIAWQSQRPVMTRDSRGRIKPLLVDVEFDKKVSRLMKSLKTGTLDTVMANQADLVEVVHTLKQVMCVKGA